MANQGILGQVKPTTGSVLYAAPSDRSASLAIKVANDGTASTFDVALKDYDQKLTLDASTYKLHKGDVISAYKFTVDTSFDADAFDPGESFTSADEEKTLKFESAVFPDYTEIFVKALLTRTVAIESVAGNNITVGETISKGTAPDDTTAVVYEIIENDANETAVLRVGPSTLNGSGTEFAAGDSVTASGGGAGVVSTGGIATAERNFVFSTTTSGGTYRYYGAQDTFTLFDDRPYRFNVADSSMSGRDFSLSTTQNGEFGPDGVASSGDEGTEFTTGKTTSGTAGSSGAYIQYDFGAGTTPTTLYWYDGGTGTATNSEYGGGDQLFNLSDNYTYTSFFAFGITGTWANSTDTFTKDGTTYTVTAQSAGAFGFVRSYSGTSLYVILDEGSAEFAGSNTFKDVPKLNGSARATATVSSVAVAQGAEEAENLIVDGKNLTANSTESLTSIVLAPGERIVVSSATANNAFTAVGFEDSSTDLGVRVYNPTAS